MRRVSLALLAVLLVSCGKDDDGDDGDSGGTSGADDGGTGTGDSGSTSGSDDGGDSTGSGDDGTATGDTGSDCAGEAIECGEGHPDCCGDLLCIEAPNYPYGDLWLCAQEGECVGPGSVCTQLPCCEDECVDAGPTAVCSG
jgi:hypothetical protein